MQLKSARHHWWPVTVSKHWKGEDGFTGFIQPDGEIKRIPPDRLGAIRNGHHVKLSRNGEPTPLDHSIESEFDAADGAFSKVIAWLEDLNFEDRRGAKSVGARFVVNTSADDQLTRLVECLVSLVVRSPMNRAACVGVAESVRGRIESRERDNLIALNMQRSQRWIADSIGSRGKFCVVRSPNREFIFGDGFFCNFRAARFPPPMMPRIIVPITPRLCVVFAQPSHYRVDPKLTTLTIDATEADAFNDAVQIYSRDFLFFRSEPPPVRSYFTDHKHQCFSDRNNSMDRLIELMPGVLPPFEVFGGHLFSSVDQDWSRAAP